MSVYSYILKARQEHRKLLAILLDQEKTLLEGLQERVYGADLVLVGSSTGSDTSALVRALHRQTDKKVLLFPGNPKQVCGEADALLFLSLLSSRNPEWLIGQQVEAALDVQKTGIETIPTGYILLDGGIATAVQQATSSLPISQDNIRLILSTAVAACMTGKKLVYLEAGSGALTPVRTAIINEVRQHIDVPLIVGGGIRTTEQMHEAFNAGADIVVIGNYFEQHPEHIPLFAKH